MNRIMFFGVRATRVSCSLLAALLLLVTSASAQFSVRAGAAGGGTAGDWGRVTGVFFGIGQMTPTRSYGWWSTHFDLDRFTTRVEDETRLSGLRIINQHSVPPETTAFKNAFAITGIMLGARYEPCRSWLGFRQTANLLISPYVGWQSGYMRFEHDESTGLRGIGGVSAAHGIPVGGTAGVFIGWGGQPEGALDRSISSTYTGMEISLDVTGTAWISNRTFVSAMTGFPEGLKAPALPRMLLRIALVHRTAPVRRM